jgi:hypothetical protein
MTGKAMLFPDQEYRIIWDAGKRSRDPAVLNKSI